MRTVDKVVGNLHAVERMAEAMASAKPAAPRARSSSRGPTPEGRAVPRYSVETEGFWIRNTMRKATMPSRC
jgi:hypothetical protein